MEKLTVVSGVGVPLRRSNVDTDQIIPAVFLKRVTKTGFDDALFYAWRRNPEFVLNRSEYANGKILVTGPDFGTGSSREHAVWALHDYGFKVIISPRFADIFYGNTAKNGVLAAIMPQESIELLWKLLEEKPGRAMTVDLVERTVTCGDVTLPFEVNDYTRWRLMNGFDDIDLTLQHEDDITAYEKLRAERFPFKPKTLPAKHMPEHRIASAREQDEGEWSGPISGQRGALSAGPELRRDLRAA
ncbi:MAG: 3-isopropylmalate dehydratase small subunit [Bifidobacterium subtile]|jgi:3-isopropylmalate/(R)-2-methylmalate dehydratase small subunit|nr:3-isopropylmalate dehydratase small subunit [Bifidobacterium subtile]